MNRNIYIIGTVILLLIASFSIGRCTKTCEVTPTTVTVTTPEVKGSFESPQVLKPESNNIKTVIKLKDSIVLIPQVNEELMQKYLALENQTNTVIKENERLKLYSEAITINNYNTPFEDDNIKLNIKSKTQGILLEVKPDYIIKSKTITTNVDLPKPKEKVFSLNGGLQLTFTKDLSKFDPAVKLDFVGKKNVLSASYSKDGYISVGYTVPIFSIRK